jgi:hypothetical protein
MSESDDAKLKLEYVRRLLQDLLDEDMACRKQDKALSVGAWRSSVRLILERIR